MKIGNGIKNKIFAIQILQFLFLFSIFLFSSCSRSYREVYSLSGTTMGTTYSVKYVDSHDNSKLIIQHKIDSVLLNVNQQMSTYIPSSEISKFNSSKDTSWFKVSDDLVKVIHKSKELGYESNNFYDITIGPVVNLWGFGPMSVPNVIPTNHQIRQAKLKTGIEKLKVDLKTSKIKKSIPDLYCDLSSIAKGFGVDKVAAFLETISVDNYMVEIGGEVRTKGTNGQFEKWKIGISNASSDGLQKIISISDLSVATSGDYMNYFEKNGVRYSHLINPKTGKPITHNLVSVTVIKPNCYEADALATAIDVMGPIIGYNFALEKKLPIFMIVRQENKYVEKMTPQFENYITKGN